MLIMIFFLFLSANEKENIPPHSPRRRFAALHYSELPTTKKTEDTASQAHMQDKEDTQKQAEQLSYLTSLADYNKITIRLLEVQCNDQNIRASEYLEVINKMREELAAADKTIRGHQVEIQNLQHQLPHRDLALSEQSQLLRTHYQQTIDRYKQDIERLKRQIGIYESFSHKRMDAFLPEREWESMKF